MRDENPGRSGFDVSVLGLGAMGTIMAQAFLRQGKRVAIWNRSADKAETLVAAGAHLCESAEAALAASPVAVLVLLNDEAVRAIFDAVGVSRALSNCTIVNYTTNSKEESLALHARVNAAGGQYLKGVIVAYPRNVGHPRSYCIHTGDRDAFERHGELLKILAGHTLFLPWDEAFAFSTTLHAQLFASMVVFYEAVGASHHFGMSIPETARRVLDASRFFISDALEDAVRRFESGNFAGDQARLDVHASAFEYLAEAMQARGASIPIFDAVCDVTRSAQSMGYGDQDISAAVKTFAPEAAVTGVP
ncbi:NAD(P)-dependent oxidoreductase [Sphingomonas sp. CL5.1]|uniref:NAD(P)-dependent oxidoreductase n=1 Tax=Sphingomonas sp. CL5.1 TaxID=2653203 RepID=UPI0015822379|nr:NAD(P)-binding domain-containing protein [Sphingomonas sp. CL5.1]QKR99862.1 NAD(P)-dependent oxidoreductase [Sphingomonas sp. CL5.1]